MKIFSNWWHSKSQTDWLDRIFSVHINRRRVNTSDHYNRLIAQNNGTEKSPFYIENNERICTPLQRHVYVQRKPKKYSINQFNTHNGMWDMELAHNGYVITGLVP